MTEKRTSLRNILILGALLMPALASCGGSVSTPTPSTQPPVTTPPVTTPPVTTPPVTTPPVTTPPVTTPPVTTPPVTLPDVSVTIDRPSIQLVEKANVPPQTFILTINRTPEQVPGLHMANANLLGPDAPTITPIGSNLPEVKNGVTTWYMRVDASAAVQGDYTFTLNITDQKDKVIGSVKLQVKVTHDLRLDSDPTTWHPYEQQLLALVNEVRTQGTLNGSATALNGTCAAGATPRSALQASSVAYLAARGHANWFATYGYTAHDEPDATFPTFYGATLSDRLIHADSTIGSSVSWSGYGENAAAGMTSPMEVMKAWLFSPGHCANIMNPIWTHMGAGYAAADAYRPQPRGDIFKDNWEQVFLRY